MMKKVQWKIMALGLLVFTLLANCGGGGTANSAAGSIEAYLNALVNREEIQMITLSCAEWELRAKEEYNSFAAVKITLENLECKETGSEGGFALVACTGKILANYGAEDLEIDLAGQTYQTRQEGGEWRMCGYR